MGEPIRVAEFKRMLRGAAAMIRENHAWLSQLDSAGGDGDHGATMLRAMDRVEAEALSREFDTLQALLDAVGWTLLGIDGGATGPLLGTLFLGLAEASRESWGDAGAVATAFESGIAALEKQTTARAGDKTMMDSLTPAVVALRSAANDGRTIAEAFTAASDAARAGATATASMVARCGRAKYLGERTRGHQDAGATSVALIFEGFQQSLRKPGGAQHA
jgi:dihydroxyacetone kinase-like protein